MLRICMTVLTAMALIGVHELGDSYAEPQGARQVAPWEHSRKCNPNPCPGMGDGTKMATG